MKKFILALLVVINSNAFAYDYYGAPEAFLSILPKGKYGGVNPKGKKCVVLVEDHKFNDTIYVTVNSGGFSKREATIDNFSVAMFNVQNSEFYTRKRIAIIDNKFKETGAKTFRNNKNQLVVEAWDVLFNSEVIDRHKSVCILSNI